MTSSSEQLSSLQQHSSTLEQSLAAVGTAVDENLNGSKMSGPAAQSPKGKPVRGVSKSKRAALVLDAMKPILASALEQVGTADMNDAFRLWPLAAPVSWLARLLWSLCCSAGAATAQTLLHLLIRLLCSRPYRF